MKIANLHELQNIFAKVNLGEIPGEDPVFILINSTSLLFGDELMKQLALISKEQQLLAIALIVEHTDAPRIDSLIIVCRKAEINSFFCNKLMAYVNDTTSNIISYVVKLLIKGGFLKSSAENRAQADSEDKLDDGTPRLN